MLFMAGKSVIDLFDERVAASADVEALRYHDGAGWKSVTWSDWSRRSVRIAAGLQARGVAAGDRVAIIGRPCLAWLLVDMAIWQTGAVSVPIHHATLPGQIAAIVRDSGARVVVVEDPHQLEKIAQARERLDDLSLVVVMSSVARLDEPDAMGRDVVRFADVLHGQSRADWFTELDQLVDEGATRMSQDPNSLLSVRAQVGASDVATIIYTSGTSGRPRGVVFTHDSLVAQMDTTMIAAQLRESDVTVLFLPLSFAFGRSMYLAALRAGSVCAIGRGPARLLEDLGEIRPTFFFAVPYVLERILSRFQDRVLSSTAGPARAIARAQFAGAADLAARVAAGEPLSLLQRTQAAVVHRTLWAAFRKIFGGQLRYIVCGGAPLSRQMAWFYQGAGVLVLEGYGLTETCGAVSSNRPQDYKFGTVGLTLSGCEVQIAADGEILVRGRHVMQGYWNDPESTAAALVDGWLHTGDLGEFDGEHLRITGRKKEMIITATGRSVAPSPLESRLGEIPMVEHAVVYGDGRPYLVALLTLQRHALEQWAKTNQVQYRSLDELRREQRVYDHVKESVDALNREVAPVEAIRRFVILGEDFRFASGELTASGQTRRRFVVEKYRALLDDLYDVNLKLTR
jgi:long-chain acyl-CoA synthetase